MIVLAIVYFVCTAQRRKRISCSEVRAGSRSSVGEVRIRPLSVMTGQSRVQEWGEPRETTTNMMHSVHAETCMYGRRRRTWGNTHYIATRNPRVQSRRVWAVRSNLAACQMTLAESAALGFTRSDYPGTLYSFVLSADATEWKKNA